jgi:hypothetical protein
MKKKIDLAGSQWFKIHTPFFPFRLGGKWNWGKQIKITYLINTDGESIPIKTELIK